jgi:hypothetical protein
MNEIDNLQHRLARMEAMETDGGTGWIPISFTLTYASANTFTAVGNWTDFFTVGLKFKFTQTTLKYFYVVGASYSAPNTTVTVTAGSDYAVANAAIVTPFYSRDANPVGFPQWFNWTPSITGYSANPTNTMYRFNIIGRMVTAIIREGTNGTATTGTTTYTAPVASANTANGQWIGFGLVIDATALQVAPCQGIIGINTTTITMYKDGTLAALSTSGGKRIVTMLLSYEI